MKKIIENSFAAAALVLIWFVILFDPTEQAIGTTFLTLPTFMLVSAEILGNIVWILGLIFFVTATFLIILLFNEKSIEKTTRASVKREIQKNGQNVTPHTITGEHGTTLFKKHNWWGKALIITNSIGSFVAIGSGFWFTGSGWLLVIISGNVFRKVGIEIAEDVIKEELEKTYE